MVRTNLDVNITMNTFTVQNFSVNNLVHGRSKSIFIRNLSLPKQKYRYQQLFAECLKFVRLSKCLR